MASPRSPAPSKIQPARPGLGFGWVRGPRARVRIPVPPPTCPGVGLAAGPRKMRVSASP
eukprot:CAMPEP_0183560144 /NCGR_PEP_ID=MMETSP0371-20130417/93948_1 /TAXON_ID=268820 /ORGANISM="Peridinium aciculiferum, Strain PAER-2" /LENGTH=58 /DNA_ID=CAMNT_0025768259 /DNA_START=18 /DNA_END=191 /DNA_ORIENTATION=+